MVPVGAQSPPPDQEHMTIRARSILPLALCASAAIVLNSCHDPTAPKDPPFDQTASALLNAAGAVVVSRDSMRGWAFYDDQNGLPCTDATLCGLVQGPAATPSGSGSAELTAYSALDGPALILADYGGTRFDRITQLRYSTYRQSHDAGNNLAIALQFNVDYDLEDQNRSWQGRLVFEPYQGVGGNVAGAIWTSWDAKAGRWWGTKASVPANGVATTNPCVQATPCTWSQLLARYPNVGVHAVYGAVVLKAGSGWSNFRGNVDSLAIGVDGVSTVFDFELSTTPPTARLRTRIGRGVVGAHLPLDSSYGLGSTVAYAFAVEPGHDSLVVIVDGEFAPSSGVLTMDQPHTLEAEADSVYTIEQLSPDGAAIATRVSDLLTSGDKRSAYQNIIQSLADRLQAGANIDSLQREAEIAWGLTADPVRDSAALSAVDEALNGYTVRLEPTEWGATMVSLEAPSGTQNESERRDWSSHLNAQSKSVRVPTSTMVSRGTLDPDEEVSPRQPTVFVYVNGIKTDEVSEDGTGAAFTALRLKSLITTSSRFKVPFFRVEHVLNKRAELQLAEWDAAHPCVKVSMAQQWLHGPFRKALRYHRCMEARNEVGFTTLDLVEAATARIQLILHLSSTNPDVPLIADRIRADRARGENVIMVGHSEGTLLIAQAVRALPALDGHPVQVANSCVASLSLGTPADRNTFGLDREYNTGFIVEGDVILVTGPTGWDIIHTPLMDRMQAILNEHPDSVAKLLYGIRLGPRMHSIDKSYLGDSVARAEVLSRLTSLHKECVQQTLTVTPPSQTVRAGDEFSFVPHLYNQNGRELFGRTIDDGPGNFTPLGNFSYRAHIPRDPRYGAQSIDVSTPYLYQEAEVTVPLVPVAGASLTEKDSSWWAMIGASNGGLDDPPLGFEQGPGGSWDGAPGSCGTTVTINGRMGPGGQSYGVFELRCMRLFTVTYGVVTDPEVAPQVDHFETRFHGSSEEMLDPRQMTVACGPEICLDSIEVVAIDRYRESVGTSGRLVSGQSSAPSAPVTAQISRSSDRADQISRRSFPKKRNRR